MDALHNIHGHACLLAFVRRLRKISGPSTSNYDLNHTLRWFFYFTPDLRKVKSSHHPASGEE